ncbi:type II secretion system protein E (GspE) [Fontimonas thermophila]|uniref:Type II secretion system protein E n=1 Tax=Fontimonas thermophila TaxID=1076937 RepID=A0A1I2ID60_9GAMM|nr:type II secretion system ATPase GspE [Fontimonas thermophila]SFF40235.1 type II secretion system protein E (GspE) [Fontimonas thermophila]
MESVLRRPPFTFAKRHGLIVTEDRGDHVIAVARPGVSIDAIQETRRYVGRPLRLHTVTAQEFDALLSRTYEGQTTTTASLIEGLDEEPADLDALAQALQENQDLLESDDDAPIIKFINGLLVEAIRENASDIHIESFESRLQIRFRVDGVLREVMSPPKSLAPRLVSRIKVMAKLDIAEKRLPQDGRISRAFGGRKVDVRVSTIPTGQNHERVVMRILDKQTERLDLEQLGLDEQQITTLKRIIHRPYGILLVTGPTGSGKTTTLYSALSVLNDRTRNIMTVEDPIEYYIDGVGQTQVNTKVEMTFARGLRAILRQDPDVVMVGEIRDLETAQIAVQASQTGHLVLSTLHTNTAVGAVTRLRDMGVEPYQLSSSLIGLMAQRLVRQLCAACKQPYEASTVEKEQLGVDPARSLTLYKPVGCPQCRHIGFLGRTGIHEIIEIDRKLEAMIHDNASEQALEAYARTRGPGILQSGRNKVLAGQTTLREVLRVTIEE